MVWGVSRKQFVNCVVFWLCKSLWIPLYKWGGIVKSFEKFSNSLPFWYRFDGYQLRELFAHWYENNLWILLKRGVFLPFWSATTWGYILMLILRIQARFFLTYRALKVAANYRPGRRKWASSCGSEVRCRVGFLTNNWCLQSVRHSEQALPLSLQRRLACFCVFHS